MAASGGWWRWWEAASRPACCCALSGARRRRRPAAPAASDPAGALRAAMLRGAAGERTAAAAARRQPVMAGSAAVCHLSCQCHVSQQSAVSSLHACLLTPDFLEQTDELDTAVGSGDRSGNSESSKHLKIKSFRYVVIVYLLRPSIFFHPLPPPHLRPRHPHLIILGVIRGSGFIGQEVCSATC